MAQEINIEDRRTRELEVLSRQGFAAMSELVQHLKVSESTVRRDLELLEEQGIIRRTHGGAFYVKDPVGQQMAFADRQGTAIVAKQSIARSVADLITPEQTVLLDGGTTCFQVAQAIRGRRLSVITNSVPIAALLSAELATEVTLVGGYVYPRTGVAIGEVARQQLSSLHAGRLVLSCAGMAADGVFNANQMMVDVERAMMSVADEVILAADHTKFGKRGVVKLCELDQVDVIVTDSETDEATRQWLGTLKARIVYAS